MSNVQESSRGDKTEFLSTVINALAMLVKEKMYGPLDILATTPDPNLVYSALYNAIRYLATQGLPVPSEDDINKFFAIAKDNPEILREVAIKALIRGIKLRQQQGGERQG